MRQIGDRKVNGGSGGNMWMEKEIERCGVKESKMKRRTCNKKIRQLVNRLEGRKQREEVKADRKSIAL